MALFINGEISSNEILDAQAHVWNHIFKFINTMSLNCAIELGIPDIIHKHGEPMSHDKLIEALPIDKAKSQHIYRLMRLLIHSDFFVKIKISKDEQKEGYWLTPASRLLLKDDPMSMQYYLQVISNPILMEPWHYLSNWLSNDNHSTAFEIAHGGTIWEQMGHVPKLNYLFNKSMANDGHIVNSMFLRDGKNLLEGFELLVDVGGGTGSTAMAIGDEFPAMKCIVFDLPHVVDGLEGSEKLMYVGGDMFQAVPNADLVLLKWILHDWNDEESVKILKKCKEAISNNKNGKVIIIDMVINHNEVKDKEMEDQLFFDMAMMVYMNGKERNENEWAKLFSDAGFSGYNIALGLGVRSVIEVYP